MILHKFKTRIDRPRGAIRPHAPAKPWSAIRAKAGRTIINIAFQIKSFHALMSKGVEISARSSGLAP